MTATPELVAAMSEALSRFYDRLDDIASNDGDPHLLFRDFGDVTERWRRLTAALGADEVHAKPLAASIRHIADRVRQLLDVHEYRKDAAILQAVSDLLEMAARGLEEAADRTGSHGRTVATAARAAREALAEADACHVRDGAW